MLLTGEDLQHLSYVIIDEIHFLDDLERGTVWEEVLIYLPPSVNILGLSATLANIQEFADWLTHVRGMQVEVVISDRRHVPLDIYLANRDAGICNLTRFEHLHERWVDVARKKSAELKLSRDKERRARGGRRRGGGRRSQRLTLPGQSETRHFEIIRMLGDSFRPLLYFVFSRKMSEQFARELSRRGPEDGFTTEDEKKLIKERVDQFDEDFLKVMTSEQETMYLKGIAYHHTPLEGGALVCDAVHVSNSIAKQLGQEEGHARVDPDLCLDSLERLGMSEGTLQRCYHTVESRLEQVLAAYN